LSEAVAISSHCRNCDHDLGAQPGRYCPACGQETALHVPTAGEFLHEFIGHYVAIEGRLAKTMWLLFFKPGQLTRAYLEGKRRQYVLPLRLYLTASIIFFLLVKVLGAGNLFKVQENADPKTREVLSQAQDEMVRAGIPIPKPGSSIPKPSSSIDPNGAATDILRCDVTSPACQKVKTYLDQKYANRTTREMGHEVKDRAIAWAPYAMFLFVPVFALITQLLYRRRKLYYGEHLVYAFHIHAFTFFLLVFLAFLPETITPLFSVFGMIYYFLAMRHVFGGRWWATSLRYIVIATVYPVLLAVAMAATFAVAVFL
jgi:hypothetical protein